MAGGPDSGPHTCRTGALTNRLQPCSLSFFTNNFYLDEFYDNIKIFLVNEEVLITNDFFILYYLLVM